MIWPSRASEDRGGGVNIRRRFDKAAELGNGLPGKITWQTWEKRHDDRVSPLRNPAFMRRHQIGHTQKGHQRLAEAVARLKQPEQREPHEAI